MITILIFLSFSYYNVTLDAKEIYNVQSYKQCKNILPLVITEYGANSGVCMYGDILSPTENNI